MTAKKAESPYVPLDMTAEVFEQLFAYVEQHPNYKPYPAELDQFFQSRIWAIIEEGMKLRIAGLYRKLADPTITKEQHVALCATVASLQWMLNLRDNLFEARRRATPPTQ